MSDTQFQAGQYQLVNVYLTNYDRTSKIEISQLIAGFTINESMSNPFLNGSTTVFDGQDILSRLPVIGEEFIQFTYTDFFGQTRSDLFTVYSVSDVKYPDASNPTMIQYTLNFVSIPRILSDSNRIMKAYKGDVISKYVKSVFDDIYMKPLKDKQFPTKELHSDTTSNVNNLVIPNYTPTETFLFFARHAFKTESKTQTFRFFENRDAYFFGTNEYVRDWYGMDGKASSTTTYYDQSQGLTLPNAHIYSYNYLPNLGPENQLAVMNNAISLDFGEKVNSINDIKYGAYKKRVSEINILNGTAQIVPVYSIRDDYKEKNVKLAHSNNYIEDTMTDKHLRFVIKDYSGAGDPSGPEVRSDMNYMDLYTRKTSYLYHYNQNTVEATIYGKSAIVAGSVINLQIPLRKIADNNRAGDEVDIERSGYYLVNEVKNIFTDKTYTQNLKLSRYGIGTK